MLDQTKIPQYLERCMSLANLEAQKEGFHFVSTEAVLLQLLDNEEVRKTLLACGAKLGELRLQLTAHIKSQTRKIASDKSEPIYSLNLRLIYDYSKIIAKMRIAKERNSTREYVIEQDLLLSMFGIKDSPTIHYLNQQGVTEDVVINYIAFSIKKRT